MRAPQEFAYTTGWNERLRKPLLGRVWLSEAGARERFEQGEGGFQVLDGAALTGAAPSFILTVKPYSAQGWLSVSRHDGDGSTLINVDLRPRDGRYFLDRVTSWTYPKGGGYHSMSDLTSMTTTTFEPDGTGTFELRDKVDPENSVTMEARDIPVADHWIDRLEFGAWDVLLELPMLHQVRPGGHGGPSHA